MELKGELSEGIKNFEAFIEKYGSKKYIGTQYQNFGNNCYYIHENDIKSLHCNLCNSNYWHWYQQMFPHDRKDILLIRRVLSISVFPIPVLSYVCWDFEVYLH